MKTITLFFAAFFLAVTGLQSQELKIKTEGVNISFNFPSDNCTGTLSGLDAHITFDKENPGAAVIYGSVKVNTIKTGNPKRDEHLKSSDYFDAVKYPTFDFKATATEVAKVGFKMTGKLIIKGIDKPATFLFTYSDMVFKASATIYVRDYGIMSKKTREETKTTISITIPIEG